jgi:hypothetical protein
MLHLLNIDTNHKKTAIGNCGGNCGCGGTKVGNCGGCRGTKIGNSSGATKIDPATIKAESEAKGMTVDEYVVWLQNNGQTEKASVVKTWIKDGTLVSIVSQGFDLLKMFKSSSIKTGVPDPLVDTEDVAEQQKSTKVWNGLPVWGWVVMVVVVVVIGIALIPGKQA